MGNSAKTLEEKALKVLRHHAIENYSDVRDIALYVADNLLVDAEYLDWEYLNSDGSMKERSEEIKLLNKLYFVIHSCVTINECYNTHEDWREETKKMWQLFLKEE